MISKDNTLLSPSAFGRYASLRCSEDNVKLFAAKPRITKKIEEEWSEAERPEADEIFFVIRGGAANNARCSWSERAGQ